MATKANELLRRETSDSMKRLEKSLGLLADCRYRRLAGLIDKHARDALLRGEPPKMVLYQVLRDLRISFLKKGIK